MTFNGLEIHLRKISTDKEISFKNMDISQLRLLQNTIKKLIEIDERTDDLEVTFEDGSWKILLLSTILTFTNPDQYSAKLAGFTKFINSNFKEIEAETFNTTDKRNINKTNRLDISQLFSSTKNKRSYINDSIQFLNGVQIDDINLKDEITYTFDDSVKSKKLKNGLNSYFDTFTHSELKKIHRSKLFLCIIETNSKYAGIVGVFSSYNSFDFYSSNYDEFLDLYNKMVNEDSLQSAINLVSNKILDVFENKYSSIIFSSSVDLDALRDLHSFLSLFINRNFDKQIHVNILTYLGFIEPSILTISLKKALNEYYFSNILS